MNRDDIYQLLIEYAEGTLESSRRAYVEAELKKSNQLRSDLALLQSTFDSLQHQEEESVSSHYFSNFLPRLREKIEKKRPWSIIRIPAWPGKLAVPVAAAAVMLLMSGLYGLLMPDPSNRVLSAIVQEAEQDELDGLMSSVAPFETAANFAVSTAASVNTGMLADELTASSSLYDNVVYDVQILSQMDEQDVDMILQQLNSESVH